MSDRTLSREILLQIAAALDKIAARVEPIKRPEDFTSSPAGQEKLDSICMLFLAVGEAVKHIDRITRGELLAQYPDIDWKGVMGFRDIIAHHYFDIDADQVFWLCRHALQPLTATIHRMIQDLGEKGY